MRGLGTGTDPAGRRSLVCGVGREGSGGLPRGLRTGLEGRPSLTSHPLGDPGCFPPSCGSQGESDSSPDRGLAPPARAARRPLGPASRWAGQHRGPRPEELAAVIARRPPLSGSDL